MIRIVVNGMVGDEREGDSTSQKNGYPMPNKTATHEAMIIIDAHHYLEYPLYPADGPLL